MFVLSSYISTGQYHPGNKIVRKNVIIRLDCFLGENMFGNMQPPVVKHVKCQAKNTSDKEDILRK